MTGVFVMVVNTMSISVDVGRLLFVSPYLVGVVIVVCRPASRRKSWSLFVISKRLKLVSPTTVIGAVGCVCCICSSNVRKSGIKVGSG